MGPDGLANVGQKLKEGDIIVNRYVPEIQKSDQKEKEDRVLGYMQQVDTFKNSQPSYVDRIMLSSSEDSPYQIKVMQR